MAQNPEPIYFFDSGIWAKLAQIPEPNVCFEKVGVVVPLVGESCNWYCRSVLLRFFVLHLNFGVGGGNTMTN